jgi:hypothetical protein
MTKEEIGGLGRAKRRWERTRRRKGKKERKEEKDVRGRELGFFCSFRVIAVRGGYPGFEKF